jgi:hypothetical protein
MNEIIKFYICQTSCKIVVKKLQKVLTYVICRQMDEWPHWHFVHNIGMCVRIWREDSCKEVAYSCMWITLYIWYYIQHKLFDAIATTCLLALKVV